MRILIVEDEIKIRNGMVRLLSEYPEHEVVGRARNGQEGLELITALHPDLVITDIRMPVMDGLEMLEEVRKAGIRVHSVILTGYAEFEYAKRALEFGTDDYLLKPIGVEDVERVLQKVQEKVLREKRMFEGTPDGYFRALLSGILEETPEEIARAEQVLRVSPDRGVVLLGICCPPDMDSGKKAAIMDAVRRMESSAVTVCSCILKGSERWIVALLQEKGPEAGSASFPAQLLEKRRRTFDGEGACLWMTAKAEGIRGAAACFEKIQQQAPAVSLSGTAAVADADETERTCTPETGLSPRKEAEFLQTLAGSDVSGAGRWISGFIGSLKGQHCSGTGIRGSARRLGELVEEQTKRLWPERLRALQALEISSGVQRAMTGEELEALLVKAVQTAMAPREDRGNIRSFTVLRAIAYIRDHYAERLSQEEVAQALSITPEYLSTLFAREMGVNYSVFVNRFRVSQAKRLLRGSDLKIYEVAERTGFSDTKYFSKVFRDIAGMSPREFRESL